MKRIQLIGGLVSVLALSACGGDGDPQDQPAAANTVPDSALASSSAYTEFVGTVVRGGSEEALILGTADAPASDSEAPVPVS